MRCVVHTPYGSEVSFSTLDLVTLYVLLCCAGCADMVSSLCTLSTAIMFLGHDAAADTLQGVPDITLPHTSHMYHAHRATHYMSHLTDNMVLQLSATKPVSGRRGSGASAASSPTGSQDESDSAVATEATTAKGSKGGAKKSRSKKGAAAAATAAPAGAVSMEEMLLPGTTAGPDAVKEQIHKVSEGGGSEKCGRGSTSSATCEVPRLSQNMWRFSDVRTLTAACAAPTDTFCCSYTPF